MLSIKNILDIAAKLRPSTIEFITSKSFEITGGEGVQVGATLEGIKVKDNSDGDTQWLDFAGIGGGVGIGLPIGGSISSEDCPSFGSSILRGPTNWGNLGIWDLTGYSRIYSFSGAIVAGLSGSLIFFNVWLSPPPLPPFFFKAALWVEGVVGGIPGVGCMMYHGLWSREGSIWN
jgi:hypothetical protein